MVTIGRKLFSNGKCDRILDIFRNAYYHNAPHLSAINAINRLSIISPDRISHNMEIMSHQKGMWTFSAKVLP